MLAFRALQIYAGKPAELVFPISNYPSWIFCASARHHEFVFAQQILTTEKIKPWKFVGIKLVISTIAATGSVWVMTMVNFRAGVALLFLGLLFILVGLGFVSLSRISLPSAQIVKKIGA